LLAERTALPLAAPHPSAPAKTPVFINQNKNVMEPREWIMCAACDFLLDFK